MQRQNSCYTWLWTRMAEIAGANEDQIRRPGWWNNSAMEKVLPRCEAMRSLVGFPSGSGYHLPCDLPCGTVQPEETPSKEPFRMWIPGCEHKILRRILAKHSCRWVFASANPLMIHLFGISLKWSTLFNFCIYYLGELLTATHDQGQEHGLGLRAPRHHGQSQRPWVRKPPARTER